METIQINGTANIETMEDGKKDIVLYIDNTELAFEEDKINIKIILNSVCIGSWR